MASSTKAWIATLKQQIICRILLIIVILISSLIIVLLETMLYITVKPWNCRLYRKIDCCLASIIGYPLSTLLVIAFLIQWWSGTEIEVFSHPSNQLGKEHAILLPNHKFGFDWAFFFPIASFHGILGNFRIFCKKSIQYIPSIGWSLKLHEYPLLERNWESDKSNIAKDVAALIFYNDPGMLMFFPEGTRFTKEKHEVSMSIAKAKGLPEMKHHLLPRTRGFVEIMKVLRSPYFQQVPVAIYDTLIAVLTTGNDKNKECLPISFMRIFKGEAFHVKILLRRYPIHDIPQDDKECAMWLLHRFQEKDMLLDNFMKTGDFFSGEEEREKYKETKSIILPKMTSVLINFILTCVAVISLVIAINWKSLIGSKEVSVESTLCIPALLALGYFGLNALDNKNKSENASRYGLKAE